MNLQGNLMMPQLAKDLDIPFRQNGSLVLCMAEEDLPKLHALRDYEVTAVNKVANGLNISPSMRQQLFDSLSGGEKTRVNLGRLIKSLSGFYLINSANASVNAALYNDADRFIAKGQYEMLMESKDNGETVRMYTMGDEETVTGFVMVASEKDECTFICIDGQMKREELEKLLSESID